MGISGDKDHGHCCMESSGRSCREREQAGAGGTAGCSRHMLEMDSLGLRYSGSGDIGCWFVDFRGPKYRGS